ncbi:hypothetical protein FPSE_11473 [Fusarium pseudograminearum CS3096]|uniref:Uncharacterized protein n=1 Tax=Fusarium pseudograminearum (strain CS3096) TaxID=1028729 RepID=K3VX86_FUSPC|nr:hypothetical protein FPSE_11473 [Fusarium pseudograminearum CS3096]EKJ68465.1 hypothetical protein FPSE_11473 [Fusarium pseudograminearum CS3096]
MSATYYRTRYWTAGILHAKVLNVGNDEPNKLNPVESYSANNSIGLDKDFTTAVAHRPTYKTEILRSPAFRRNNSTWVVTDGSHIGIRSSRLYWIACLGFQSVRNLGIDFNGEIHRGIDEMGWEADIRCCI